ncbi:MAG: type II secretion system protein GspL [Gammaproteobacteria bacterium]|nr:type II secretion system protein GspL [Gammaproteobacteria bacterium]MDH5801891.1 type II secretion system protein GspL [Gammaproteobacteria bacterium]
MKRKIFIKIPSNFAAEGQSRLAWVVQEPGQMPGPLFYGDAATASNHATACKVIVLVSGFDILLTDVALPVMNKQRLTKALPFAMEEQLVSDLDLLHFATGRRTATGTISCAVLERTVLESWLRKFKQAGLHPDVICSEAELLPYEEGNWSVVADTGDLGELRISLRLDEQKALTLDLENLPHFLAGQYEALDDEQRPEKLSLVLTEDQSNRQTLISLDDAILVDGSEPTIDQPAGVHNGNAIAQEVLQELKEFCKKHDIAFDFTPSEQSHLSVLAQQYEDGRVTNLLQGEYSRSEQLGKMLRPWRAAAAVLAAWMLLQSGLFVSEYRQLASEEQELRNQITQVFKQAFPETRSIVDPKLQMEKGLRQLQQGSVTNVSLFSLLSQAGKIFNETQSVTLNSIRFDGGKLDVDIHIADLESLDKLKARLINEAKLEVDIVSASSRDQKVESRLQLKQSS